MIENQWRQWWNIVSIKDENIKGYQPNKAKEKKPDLNTSYKYLSKTKALNADKQMIETMLGNLTENNIDVKRKTPKDLD